MPTPTEHIKKYAKNRKLIDEGVLCDNYKDWNITVIFYCALHLIEKVLFESTSFPNKHCGSHTKRNNAITMYSEFDNIRQEYLSLYDLSLQARYTTDPLSKDDMNFALELLEKIESKYIA